MTDKLEIIRHIIEFHHTIRERVKLVGGSISDLEALFSLRGEYAGWSRSSLDELVKKQNELKETFDLLEDGLKKHFAYEEENLPEILGEALFAGLLLQHNNLRNEITAAKSTLFNSDIKNASRDEIIILKSRLQQTMDSLSQRIESHASGEEIVLNWAREGLEIGKI